MAFEIRFATEEDVPEIVAVEEASMSNPWKAPSYIEAINSDHAFVVVATEVDAVAGFAVFYLTPPEAELPDIVVDANYRGRGLGKSLLDFADKELQARDVDTIFLEVRVSNDPAKALYTKFGFEEIGKRKYFYSNPVEDAICMRFERTP